MTNSLPSAGGLLDQPWILMEQWNIIFDEEKNKAAYDEKTAAVREAQENQSGIPPGIRHERTIMGG